MGIEPYRLINHLTFSLLQMDNRHNMESIQDKSREFLTIYGLSLLIGLMLFAFLRHRFQSAESVWNGKKMDQTELPAPPVAGVKNDLPIRQLAEWIDVFSF